jgi:N-acetylglucosaminyldiphosphoundecaprenol N-acetyl-beta-D-mannosaminyltransferase
MTNTIKIQKRLKILDIWVDPVDRKLAIDKVRQFLDGAEPCSIFAANPEKNFSVPKDPVLYSAYEHADLLIPDGIGIVLAAKLLYGVSLKRVPGVELMKDICKLAAENRKSVFLFGSQDWVNEAAANTLQRIYPELHIAGRSHGYVSEKKMPELIGRINDSKADILFLSLGSPTQEKWFATHAQDLSHVKVCQGIGGTLDTIVGKVKRAPYIWQRFSLEWLYRLLSEPKRIRRQRVLPIFVLKVFAAKLKSLL